MNTVLLTSTNCAEIEPEIRRTGFGVICAPLLEIEETGESAPNIGLYAGLVFTSANGVRVFTTAHPELPKDMPVYAAGPRTADEAGMAGFDNVSLAGSRAEDIVRFLPELCTHAGRLLHVRGQETAFPLAQALTGKGIETDNYIIYRARPVQSLPGKCMEAIRNRQVSHVMFFSARAGENFVRIIRRAGLVEDFGSINALCLSVRVVKSIDILPWSVTYIAQRPDRESMLELFKSATGQGGRDKQAKE